MWGASDWITSKEADEYMQAVYPRKDSAKHNLCLKMTPSEYKAAMELKEKRANKSVGKN